MMDYAYPIVEVLMGLAVLVAAAYRGLLCWCGFDRCLGGKAQRTAGVCWFVSPDRPLLSGRPCLA